MYIIYVVLIIILTECICIMIVDFVYHVDLLRYTELEENLRIEDRFQ